MSFREALSRRPALIAVVGGGLLGVGIVFSVLQLRGRGRPALPVIPERCFYTTDDGATLFADSLSQFPPFDHDGRPAVRAYVFSCDGGKHQWVQYLEKYSNEAKKEAGAASQPPRSGLLVKEPGADRWVSEASAAAQKVMDARCPDGMRAGDITAVMPD